MKPRMQCRFPPRNSPKFHAAAAKKGGPPGTTCPGNSTTALHHAANEETMEPRGAREKPRGVVVSGGLVNYPVVKGRTQ